MVYKIHMPGRIVDHQVGGNTTYARYLRDGLRSKGHVVSSIKPGSHQATTLIRETLFGLQQPTSAEELIHYVADTGPLLKPHFPSVVTVHGVASRWIDVARSSSADLIWRTRVKKAIELSDAVITVSNSSASDISAVFGVDLQNIHVIPHGIDFDNFDKPSEISEELKRKLDKPFILYLGNIEPRKNLVSLLKAFTRTEVQSLGIDLVIAGKPAWDYSESLQLINQTPGVKHVGFVSDSDRRALMQHCELFVFPSLYEGFGFPVLEALASGATVLTSNRGSLAEVSGPSIILEDCDPESISKGIVKAIQDQQLRDSCTREGKTWARQFSWDASVSSHIDVYRKVLAG